MSPEIFPKVHKEHLDLEQVVIVIFWNGWCIKRWNWSRRGCFAVTRKDWLVNVQQMVFDRENHSVLLKTVRVSLVKLIKLSFPFLFLEIHSVNVQKLWNIEKATGFFFLALGIDRIFIIFGLIYLFLWGFGLIFFIFVDYLKRSLA